MKQSVHPNETKCLPQWNKVFHASKQTVLCGETNCSMCRDKRFSTLKLKGFTLKFVFSCLFLISLDTFFLYKRNQ